MNLQQSILMSKMKERKPEPTKISRRQKDAITLAKDRMLLAEKEGRRFDGKSAEEVANILFASSKFTLMELPLNKLASPGAKLDNNNLVHQITAEGIKSEPIVVDSNVHRIGKSAKTGYWPPVIVVDGKERFEAAARCGEEKIVCWVGSLAAESMSIHADHQISSEELSTILYEAIRKDLGLDKQKSFSEGIYIKNTYPLENYCIYQYKGENYRQKYVCDMDDRSCTLVGPPKPVVQKWNDKDVTAKGTMASAINACACQDAVKAESFFARKDGKPVSLKTCMDGYMKACQSGSVKSRGKNMVASSPPGWKTTTEKMKGHPDIDNPWALAWWMDEQGYEPRYKEK